MHVEREAGHIEDVANRFYTGNRVFDEIVGLYYGMAVLVLDETMHEGRLFLLSLLKDHPSPRWSQPVKARETRESCISS
jgi:hypothetical protein